MASTKRTTDTNTPTIAKTTRRMPIFSWLFAKEEKRQPQLPEIARKGRLSFSILRTVRKVNLRSSMQKEFQHQIRSLYLVGKKDIAICLKKLWSWKGIHNIHYYSKFSLVLELQWLISLPPTNWGAITSCLRFERLEGTVRCTLGDVGVGEQACTFFVFSSTGSSDSFALTWHNGKARRWTYLDPDVPPPFVSKT